MATSKQDIQRWFEEGKRSNATHMVVVCDTFDWEDYPVYVMGEPVESVVAKYSDPNTMQKVMEVYNLSLDMQTQLDTNRVWNI